MNTIMTITRKLDRLSRTVDKGGRFIDDCLDWANKWKYHTPEAKNVAKSLGQSAKNAVRAYNKGDYGTFSEYLDACLQLMCDLAELTDTKLPKSVDKADIALDAAIAIAEIENKVSEIV